MRNTYPPGLHGPPGPSSWLSDATSLAPLLLMIALLSACESRSPAPATAPAAAAPRAPAAADPADWCGGHGLPESMCTKCNPALVEPLVRAGDWCGEHGFPESVCPQCNPMKPPAGRSAAAAGAAARLGDPADWCGGHGLPESMCTKCNPELLAKFKGSGDWCPGHGFPESVCPQCNPMKPPARRVEGAAAAGARIGDPADWCKGHALPESMCTKCNPELLEKFKGSGDWCPGHGFPESACPQCNPMKPPAGAGRQGAVAPGTRLRLRDPSIERAAGIETVPAAAGGIGPALETTARIDFDRDRMAEVRAPVPGVVVEVSATLGQRVEAGDPLFTLESMHIGELQARRRAVRARIETARAHLARQEALEAGAIASRRQVELARLELGVAEAELRAIDQSLHLSGAPKRGRDGRLVVRAPIAGTVVRRPALVGGFAGGADSLATLADTSRMWALIDVPEAEASLVRLGQEAELRADGLVGRVLAGTVSWISAEVDPRTRTVTARVEVDNGDGRLRAGQFARAAVQVEGAEAAAIVPVEAVQRLVLHDVCR